MTLDPKRGIETTERAKKLFLSSLPYGQYIEYQRDKKITVKGSHGGTYVIRCEDGVRTRNIYSKVDGTRYCFGIKNCHQYPYFDCWLAQKLIIETNEMLFLSKANIERDAEESQQYRPWINSWQ